MHVFVLIDIEAFKSREAVMGVFATMEAAKAFFNSDGDDAPEWDLTTEGQENWAVSIDTCWEIHKEEVKS